MKTTNHVRSIKVDKVVLPRAEALKYLKQLPEDSSLEDMQYHLYVLQKIERGLQDEQEGNGIPQEKMERLVASWIRK